jgi:hypothetical protein
LFDDSQGNAPLPLVKIEENPTPSLGKNFVQSGYCEKRLMFTAILQSIESLTVVPTELALWVSDF